MANYTKAVAEMYQVLQTGKPIDEAPLPAGGKGPLWDKATRAVDFEKLVASRLPDPEIASKTEVSDHTALEISS